MTQQALWDELFRLIRYEISGTVLSAPTDEADLPSLYAAARRQDLIHLVVAALQENGVAVDEKRVHQRYAAVWRGEQMTHELENLMRVLDASGVVYVPLKGAVIRTLYPEVWMRTSADVDILVHEADVDRVIGVLQKELDYHPGKRDYHDVQLTAPSGVCVELHFTLRERMPQVDAVLDTVWDYVTPSEHGCRMTPEFLIFHVLAHLSYHFSHMGSGVRPFLDLWLLRHRTQYDESVVAELCERSGLSTFYDVCCRLGERWFAGAADDDPLLDEVQNACLNGGVYGTRQGKINSSRRRSGGKVGYVWHRLFVPRSHLEILYPSLKEHPKRLPLYQVRRWGKLLRSDTRARARDAVRLNMATDEAQVAETRQLMSRLGL